jgi:predicted helicase
MGGRKTASAAAKISLTGLSQSSTPHYGQQSIAKWDLFHYTYALLHHPEYRTRYAANLKRELPRIPYAPAFQKYAEIGASLMRLHIEYEQQPEYPLDCKETGKLNWRVEKMSLSKDKTQLKYNDFLTLSGITNDPNRADDPECIVRLIGQVISISLETVKLVSELATYPIQ